MIGWFRKAAPVRQKFVVLGVVYTTLAAIPVATTALALSDALPAGTLLAMAGGALVLTMLMSVLFRTAICDPYVSSVEQMEGIAAGDFASPIRYLDHSDCVGRMSKAMEVFRANGQAVKNATATQQQVVGALGQGLSRLAASDVSYRIDETFPADYEPLRRDFNAAMQAVSEVLAAVREATSGINNGANDIRDASDDLSQRTEQQAASLEETAAAMDQITGTVRETAVGATRANSVVSETRAEAEQSGDVVRRAVEAMNGIERASAEIGDIITVIDGIAFQTNLLALNAGVEAARAGDAGKGFAVVASEVRALAQRSADAAKDVKAKINASSEQVATGVELVSETGKALQRIIGRIGEISTLVSSIATSAEQQATGLQQVNTAVNEMDGVTQQNAAMVEQATAAARSLAEEAQELARHVDRFNLGDGAPTAFAPAPAHHTPVRHAPTQSAVHRLQARVAQVGRDIAAPPRRKVAAAGGASSAAAVAADDDWTEF
ncbi:methyl-accepting chemotaxis protein [Sphingomonas sp. 2R-10]|uniref:methyl-accepting chemotaxis protein n=1 Tax=Sphingomonas sp. 2R-10 TaxID=3045148 RepID=UPI000F76D35F|nr:methyl-accepting chemotaxis protein [Sphingomonas sp. 2R-10]MDJ0276102.1 methyl-accepting chemotaxis protein [Sphingomonas sp. 2R-10]